MINKGRLLFSKDEVMIGGPSKAGGLRESQKRVISRLLLVFYPLLLLFLASCSTADKKEIVWPLPPEQPRIRFVRSINTSMDVEKRSFL